MTRAEFRETSGKNSELTARGLQSFLCHFQCPVIVPVREHNKRIVIFGAIFLQVKVQEGEKVPDVWTNKDLRTQLGTHGDVIGQVELRVVARC